ncbi:MAG: hypothetical protein AAFU71_19710 [Cyanobacteria bacterium J06632_22]
MKRTNALSTLILLVIVAGCSQPASETSSSEAPLSNTEPAAEIAVPATAAPASSANPTAASAAATQTKLEELGIDPTELANKEPYERYEMISWGGPYDVVKAVLGVEPAVFEGTSYYWDEQLIVETDVQGRVTSFQLMPSLPDSDAQVAETFLIPILESKASISQVTSRYGEANSSEPAPKYLFAFPDGARVACTSLSGTLSCAWHGPMVNVGNEF